jgi:hypothetical protein
MLDTKGGHKVVWVPRGPHAILTRYPRPTPPLHSPRGQRTTQLYQRPARFIECNASERELRAVHW